MQSCATSARETTSATSTSASSTWRTALGQLNAGAPGSETTIFAAVLTTDVTFKLALAPTLRASAATLTSATMTSSFFQTAHQAPIRRPRPLLT